MSGFVKILGPQFSTFVRSVMIACEEKGISYEYGMEHNGKPVALASEELLSLHPYGKIPVLLTDDAVICETASIIRYLDMNFAGLALQPEGAVARAEVDQWSALISRYIDQAIVRDCLLEFAFPKGEGGAVRMEQVELAKPELQRALNNLSEQLGEKPYLCQGGFSMADILLLPMLDYLAGCPLGGVISESNNLTPYLQRLRARPSAQKVLSS